MNRFPRRTLEGNQYHCSLQGFQVMHATGRLGPAPREFNKLIHGIQARIHKPPSWQITTLHPQMQFHHPRSYSQQEEAWPQVNTRLPHYQTVGRRDGSRAFFLAWALDQASHTGSLGETGFAAKKSEKPLSHSCSGNWRQGRTYTY